MKQFEKRETFFSNLNTDLESFFDMPEEELTSEEQAYVFPLQQELMEERPRYIDEELIGQGGKKFIYKVTDLKTGRPVAKAVLRVEEDSFAIERFLYEARLTSLLQHPNIIPIYDMGIKNNEAFFTMELLRGDTFHSIIKELNAGDSVYLNKFPQTILLGLFSRICDAMAYAHSVNIIHLDLKPENIHVGEFGEVHICDWGLAKNVIEGDVIQSDSLVSANDLNAVTLNGMIKGTPGYMAPEQCEVGRKKDVRTDIYALGALLYSFLTYSATIGLSPDTSHMLQSTIAGKIIPPCQKKPKANISARLEAIVMKCLEIDPDMRYQSVNELRDDLSNYLHGYAISVEDAGFFTHAKLLINRHALLSSSFALFLLIVAVLTSTFVYQVQEEEARASTAQKEAEKALYQVQEEEARASTAQKEAEKALVLLQHEMKEKELINQEIIGSLDLYSVFTTMSNYHQRMGELDIIDRALKGNIPVANRKILWFRKGVIHFIHQHFNEAVECFKNSPEEVQTYKVVEMALYMARTRSDDAVLTDREVADMVTNLHEFNRYISYDLYENHMSYLYITNRKVKPEKHIRLVLAMLCLANNDWETHVAPHYLKKVDGGYHLTLSLSRFRIFRSTARRNYLSALQLVSLDLSHSDFFELNQIYDLRGLKRLDITGCKMQEFTDWRCQELEKTGLEEIILKKSDFEKPEIELLEEYFTVIDSKSLEWPD